MAFIIIQHPEPVVGRGCFSTIAIIGPCFHWEKTDLLKYIEKVGHITCDSHDPGYITLAWAVGGLGFTLLSAQLRAGTQT